MVIDKKILNVYEAAMILGCSQGYVYHLLNSGIIYGYKYEGSPIWHIPEESIQEYIKQYRYNPVPPISNTKTSKH